FRRENVAGEWRLSSLEPRPVESDGRLSFSAQEFRHAEALVATSGQESLILLGLPYSYGYGEPRSVERVFFFTDRALYRPGQPVYFKGVLLRQESQGSSVIPERELTLLLRDTNGQELSKMALRSNSFGSFSGVFTAPSGVLTGPLTISAPGFNGIAQVRVEEYKRPKFEVQLEAPKGEFRLGERITVTGSARTLTALPLSHLPVKYTVLRETRRPWSFWGWRPPSPPREICSGETVSDENGLFQVAFPAEPDPQNGENPSLVELFTVVATVVDSTGETRTGSASLPIGFRSLSLRLSSNPWLEVGKEQLLKVEGTSAAELPVPFQGKLTVFSLPPPETAPLPPLSHPYDQPWEGIVQETPSYGTLGEKVLEREVVGEGSLKVVMKLSSGAYKAVLESEDRFHRPIREEYTFLVVDPRSERPPTTTALLLKSQSTSLRVGEELHVLFGSSFPQGCASLEFYQNGKLFKHQWLGLTDRRQELLRLPITPQMRGGFTVLATLVKGGRLLSQSLKIAVPWREKALKVSLKSFRSRMEPGVKETWTLHVEGPDAEKVLSEGVATLYDSSLDLILPHSWPPNFLGLFPQDRTTFTKLFSNYPLSAANLFTGVRLPETPP
ncbi:MAG TPA: MG2 domain-containing protein, partial [Candidatus Aminicenantes bacterium]|nr:MG2 domain-containing protein [Candidatus Aminicenantes bacterium]